jgi:hypothetical protein
MKEQYKTKDGRIQWRPIMTEKQMSHVMSNGMGGFCLNCGKKTREVEPDARKYTCPFCKAEKLYGLEELLMMGILAIR